MTDTLPLNALVPTLVIVVGNVIVFSAVQPLKALAPILVTVLSIVTVVRAVVPANADAGTVPFIVIDMMPLNAPKLILVRVVGNVTVFKLAQPLKALDPILETVLSIVTVVRVVTLANAEAGT